MKVVFDTNVFVSALTLRGGRAEHALGRVVAGEDSIAIVCASIAFTPTVLRNVDLPDMFDPVTSTPRGGPSSMEFGTASGSNG